MNTKLSTNRKLRRMSANILSIAVILALAFPAVGSVYAQELALLEGWHDGSDGEVDPNACVAFGWSADPDDRDRDVQIRILSDGEQVAEVLAGDYGEDMDELGICPEGTCRFTVNLWDLISHDEEHEITVQAYDEESADWWNLEGTPKSLTCLTPPPPNPFIAVSITEHWFWVNNFTSETLVTFYVYDNQGDENTILEFSRNTDEFGNVTIEGWEHLWNPEPGDYIVATDGSITKDLVLEYVTLDVFDFEHDLVSGYALSGREVCVGVGNENGEQWMCVIADETEGLWVADFTTAGFEFDITEDSWAGAHVSDEDGDVTASHNSGPPEPPAWFTVFPEWDAIEGWNFPLGAEVHLAIDDPSTEDLPDYEQDETVTYTPWGSWELWVWFDLAGMYDVKAGDIVTLTYGDAVRTHYVQNLAITKANHEDDTIKGIADAGAEVYVWPHATGEQQLVVAKTKGAAEGKWNVDFSGIFDLTPGECGRSEIRDEVGNSTAVDWCIPRIEIKAFPMVDVIWGYGWPEGSQVHLTLNGAVDFVPPATVGPAPWGDPNDIMAYFELTGYDLVPGDVVTLSGSGREQTHTVLNLSVMAVNATADTVTGMADQELYVWVHGFDGTELHLTPEDGMWLADFGSIPFDLTDGMCGRAEIGDEAGNSTAADWCVPPPARIVASITEDWFYLVDFAPDAAFDYAIYESQGGTQVAEGSATTDGSGFAWINADGNWDLEPGYFLIVSDGTSTKALVIEGFTFDVFDLTQGLLQGTALGAEGRLIWVGIGFENDGWSMEVFPDADGNWVADFGQPVPADYWWVAAQIFDDDGDASELRPEQIIAWGE